MKPLEQDPGIGKQAEENLPMESAALEAAANAIVITDQSGNILRVNAAFTVLTGYTAQEVLGKNPRLLKSGKQDDATYQNLWRTISSGHVWGGQLINRRKDGSLYPEEMTITPLHDASGAIARYIAIKQDITERKRAEEALRASQQIIEGIINAIPVRVFWKDKNLVYLGCNAVFARDAGFGDPKDIIGKDDYQMGWRDQAEKYRADDRHVIESGLSKLLIEESQTTPEGNTLTILTSKVPLRSAEGMINGIIGTYLDITERKQAEEELRGKTAFLEAQVNSSIDGIVVVDQNQEMSLQNQRFVDLFKLPRHIADEKDNQNRLRWVADLTTNPEQYVKAVRRLYAHPEEISRDEFELTDGRTLDRYSSPVIGKDGKYYGRIWIFRDITERQRAEEALRQSEEQFRGIFELASMGMAQANPRTGQWLRVNKKMCEITGYSASEMLQLHVEDITYPEDRQCDWEAFERVVRGEAPDYRMEKRYVRKDGALAWVNVNMTVLRNAAGQPTRTVAAIEDITARKQTENALRESNEKYQDLFMSSRDAIMTSEPPSWKFTCGNPAAVKMFGAKSEADFILHSPWELSPERQPDGRASAEKGREMIEKAMREGSHFFEWTHRRISGEEFPATVLITRMQTGDKLFQQGTVRDITESKQLEARLIQSQKMETVGKLAGGIAHEFNSILTAIIGQSELLLNDLPAGSPLAKNAGEISQAAVRAAALTRQLLAYGRKQILQPETLDLNRVITDMEGMFHHLMGADVETQIVPAPGLRAVKVDAGQIEQVIMNLAMNAREAMPNGGKFTLETANVSFDQETVGRYPELKPGDYVMLAITDTGAGMSQDVTAHVFDPFYTTKGVGQGTGLGLSTCYGIIKQSGGHISVYSEPGRGATFKIYLPQVEPETHIPPLRPGPPDLPRGTETILLVEDDPALREMAATLLRRLGYTVSAAANGIEALSLKQQPDTGHIDLLFTDVVMPHMSGKELADRVRALYPHTRILFTSAYTENAIVHQGVLDKGVALLQKPFTPSALAHKLREVLDQPRGPEPDSAQTKFGFTKISAQAKTPGG